MHTYTHVHIHTYKCVHTYTHVHIHTYMHAHIHIHTSLQAHPEGIAQAGASIRTLRPTAEEIAPRTVAALDAQGRMLLAAIDGVEALGLGLTLTELAEVCDTCPCPLSRDRPFTCHALACLHVIPTTRAGP
jgi:hypothetical protein